MKPLDLPSAAKKLLDGRDDLTVMTAMSPMQPDALCRAIVDEAVARDVALRLLTVDLPGRFDFLSPQAIDAVKRGRVSLVSLAGSFPRALAEYVDYVPNSLWDVDRMLGEGRLGVDAYLVRTGAPDASGVCSLGRAVAFTPAASRGAGQVVLQIDPGVGRFPGFGGIARADASMLVEAEPVAEAKPKPGRFSEEQQRIAEHLAGLIPDGATIQLGLGGISEAILPALRGKRDLGLHSGIVAPAIGALIADGTITGHRKSEGRARHVAAGIFGDGDAGALADPANGFELQPISMTHHPETLLRQRGLWAINSALEVDLTGQVNAEYAGGVRVASAGGQGDFARWAHVSPEGASVVALPSRTSRGIPRIVPFLAKPHAVTTTKGDVDFVVTEFGAARLSGATVAQRAESLIAIAHPADRDALEEAWKVRR